VDAFSRIGIAVSLLLWAAVGAAALPVNLGEVEIGLESSDGYQEGTAYLSVDEEGASLEILIAYRGFGLDTVTWTLTGEDMTALQDGTRLAAWWRSRLLERMVDQTVTRDIASVTPTLSYAYRSSTFPFESAEHVLRFVRQGRDYAVLLTETSPGAETRRSGEKTLPVFTVHFPGRELPALRDMLDSDRLEAVLADFAAEKAAIQAILDSGPEESDASGAAAM